ncbi:uroporphyrinogen decarboxylase [Lactonifactor longoviformis DSM 17459]|uniref:Uroporphyrinogen decarboxylase n=1 Tax=Lactonifactor longoviformis DSM 17459 TaxID=1122155 RepID=A0A1M5BML5_9CLOT|nr:uroporphyrinogen decarboxylase [Lactonifactor longoviformis DSM 17459]
METALNHQTPDRCPCDLTISPPAYQELCSYMGMAFEPYWWDSFNHAFPSPEMLEKLHVDVMHIPAYAFVPKGFDIHRDEFTDAWGVARKKIWDSETDFMYINASTPLAGIQDVEEVYAYHWPDPEELYDPDLAVPLVKSLYRDTDFALTTQFGGHLFEMGQFLLGFEDYLAYLYTEPEIAEAIMDKTREIQMKVETLVLQTIGKYLTYVRTCGEDVGTQNGPLISPDYYAAVVKPRHQAEWTHMKSEFRKQNPQGKVAVHTCGGVYPFIQHFVDAGADILNPVQPTAAGMDTARIGREFGDRICFHGGVDSVNVLMNGTTEEVKREVKKRIEDLGAHGGYICAPSHNIQSGVPCENVIALYEAVQEYGSYR